MTVPAPSRGAGQGHAGPAPHAGAEPGAGAGGPTGVALAPSPPGRLGEAAPASVLAAYLAAVGDWRAQRRTELDRLDEAALRATDPTAYTGDVLLSMTLWQAVSDRYDQLTTAFDAGRADAATRERMSALIHGRLDAGALSGAGLAVSLVDACRLSDALAAQLRARLSFDPRAADSAARVAALRAGMERLRELAKAEPGELGVVQRLTARVDDLAGAARRGADVGDRLGTLEADAARTERDLIVSTANRGHRAREAAERARVTAAQAAADRRAAQESARLAAERAAADLAADRVRAMNEVATLEHREATLHELARRCVAEIARPPRLAVPDPMALGPVPQGAEDVAVFLHRLTNVVRAMDVVEQAYGRPLAERDELTGMLGGYATMARRRAVAAVPAVASAAAAALAAVRAVPCDVDLARERVAAYQRLVRDTPPPASAPPPAAQPGATS